MVCVVCVCVCVRVRACVCGGEVGCLVFKRNVAICHPLTSWLSR